MLRKMVDPSNGDHEQYVNCNLVDIPRTHGSYFPVHLTVSLAKIDYKINLKLE